MIVAILGRQPALSMAELERVFGAEATKWFSDESALIEAKSFSIERLGGTQKAGHVVAEIGKGTWRDASTKIIHYYSRAWRDFDGKITLGISAYGFDVSSRDVQKTGLLVKSYCKKAGVSLRLVPNTEPALNSATSHHNKLGLSENKVELLVIRARNGKIIIAQSTGAQNITALARRDQGRPQRDAFVGMLPPKLAMIMLNLAAPSQSARILDPFCGTGVILQEAALQHHSVYGTDLSEKMIRYSRDNLNWLQTSHHISFDWYLHEGDAKTTHWQQPIDAVVSETYLGQPFSAPPSPAKLKEVQQNCLHILEEFLQNIAPQLTSGTSLCLAIPAWRRVDGSFTHLSIASTLKKLGYNRQTFKNISDSDLLYHRDTQVVARELLVLCKA